MSLKSSEKVETNVVKLEIAVDGATFQDAINKAFMKSRKQITVPGFRKGKATRGMIERYYGEGVFYNDAFEILYPDVVEAAVKEADIEIVDSPYDIDITEISKDGLTFSLKVTVKPEVSVKDYKGLKVEKPSVEVTDEDVDAEITALQERQARYVEAERPAENGDIVTIDFDGYVDGEPFDGGKADGYELTLGSGSFIAGFEDQIVGHKVDDAFDVNVTFPEDYVVELSGKEATFKVVLHAVKVKEVPELDDDFAMDVSDYDTLEELKENTKKDLAEKKEKEADTAVENELFEQLADLVEGEIPPVMYESQIDDSMNEFSYQLQTQGLNMETYLQFTGSKEADLRENFRAQAEKQVKCRLALEKIAELEKVEVTEDDLNEQYKKLAEMYGMEEESIRKILSAEDVSKDLLTTKAMEIVKANADISGAKVAKKPAKKSAKKTEKKETKEEAPAAAADVNLKGMTKAQLVEYAEANGIEGVKMSMTKADMIAAIEAK